MEQQKPLFTVIIPTKDRGVFLQETLKTCIHQDYENLEIIVSDDASVDCTREVVEEAAGKDSRIKYIRNDVPLGMRKNFETSLDRVKPGFVMALGGDDGLMPYGISGMYETLKQTKQQMLSWPAPTFVYPDASVIGGQLMLPSKRKKKEEELTLINSTDFLHRQATALSYASDIESPMFYVKGVVSTDLVNAVKKRSPGNLFYTCPTPDGYSGIVLAGEVSTYAFSHRPYSLFGLSKTSQGKNYLASDKEALELSESFFSAVADIPMHEKLASQPYSPLITLMTADYLFRAKDLPGWGGSFPEIDMKAVILKSIDELSHGLYANNRLLRELKILNQIAIQHGLKSFLDENLKTKKRYKERQPLSGNAINFDTIFLQAEQYNIKNIFDASYMAYNFFNVAQNFNFATGIDAIRNSIMYRFQSRKKGDPFPVIS